MTVYTIQNGDEAGIVRAGLNANADELLNTRRPWANGYQGNYCTHNGKDYDLAPGGISTEQPGNPDHWVERIIAIEVTGTAGLQSQRGTISQLEAIPANTGLELFTVEGEPINEYGEDVNGRYWRTASGAQYLWVKE